MRQATRNSAPAPADLHAHTWYSDGKYAPKKVVETAKKAGIKTIAITDHETVAGIQEAVAAGKDAGVEVVPGIEFSTRVKEVEAHILGLWIDPENPGITEIVKNKRAERARRAEKIVEKLQALKIGIHMDHVKKVVSKGNIGRPHIAQALVNVGAVTEFEEAFRRYIGRHGPAYVARESLSPGDAIDLIHEAKGVAVLAHGLIGGPQREHVKMIADMGLDAVEAVHPKLTESQSKWLSEFAAAHDLAVSGGSDWHGDGWSQGKMGDYFVNAAELQKLLDRKSAYG